MKRELANFIARESSYHFLVRDWLGKSDIDIMQYFFGLDFFHHQLRPVEPNLAHYKNVILLAPHQDDESIGAGGVLQKLNRQGSNITIVYVTDGAQKNIPNTDVEESVEVRFKEVEEALKNINCSIEKMNISNMSPKPTIDDLNHLSDLIKKYEPDLILLPWLLDIPVKHRMVNHMLVLCDQIKPIRNCEIWGYQVHNHLYPNIVINISEEMEEKIRMIEAFESQNKNFKPHNKITKGMNAYNAKYLRGADYVEIFFASPVQKYVEIVRQTYFSNLKQTYKNSIPVFKVMSNLSFSSKRIEE
ncbi:MAG: PIG-L family deacetylase [Bacteroidota bacterium]